MAIKEPAQSLQAGFWASLVPYHNFELFFIASRLADLLSRKHGTSYVKTLSLLHCSISFSLLCSAILAIRGSRTIQRVEHPHTSAELRLAEAHLGSSG